MADVPEFVKPFIGQRVCVILCSNESPCPDPERHEEHVAVGTLDWVNEYGEAQISNPNGVLHVWPVMRIEEI
jgi:hypothetical protein